MTTDSLKDTIEPKSDQLNADDLLTGPITVRITEVKRGDNDQPVVVQIEGYRPYKPCKSMRRVMIGAWGDRGADWVGKSMTLYCDPSVKFGGVQVGGIRISHMSHIEHALSMMLTTTRSRRAQYTVQPLAGNHGVIDQLMASITACDTIEALEQRGADIAEAAQGIDKSSMTPVRAAYKAKKQALESSS